MRVCDAVLSFKMGITGKAKIACCITWVFKLVAAP
jgi:hypothetical protein